MQQSHSSASSFWLNGQVLAKGIDCDIALLSVESEGFWKGAEALQFGRLPHLQVGLI